MFSNAPEFQRLTHYYPCYIHVYENEECDVHVMKAFNIRGDNDWVEEGAGDDAPNIYRHKLNRRGMPGSYRHYGRMVRNSEYVLDFPISWYDYVGDTTTIDDIDVALGNLMKDNHINGPFYKDDDDGLDGLLWLVQERINAMCGNERKLDTTRRSWKNDGFGQWFEPIHPYRGDTHYDTDDDIYYLRDLDTDDDTE